MDPQVERFQQQEREEEVGLVFDYGPCKSPLAAGLLVRKDEDREVNVGVEVDVVGISVVLVVFVDPPPTAQAKYEIGDDEAKKVTLPSRLENLPMASVVTNECELSGDER